MKLKLLSILFVGMIGCASVPIVEKAQNVEQITKNITATYAPEGYMIEKKNIKWGLVFEGGFGNPDFRTYHNNTVYNFAEGEIRDFCSWQIYRRGHATQFYDDNCDGTIDQFFPRDFVSLDLSNNESYTNYFNKLKRDLHVEEVHQKWEKDWKLDKK